MLHRLLRRLLRSTPLAFAILLLLVGTAFAADVPAPGEDTAGWLRALYEAATSGEWKILAGLVLMGFVYALRTWGAKKWSWLATPLGGLVLAFVVSLGSTLGLALAAGAAVKLSTVLSAVATAATAAGVWEWVKAHFPGAQASNDATKAKAGG